MTPRWRPTHTDPLFILAMDHRGSFGTSLFGVGQDGPTADQEARMRAAKDLTYAGLRQAVSSLGRGRAGVLVDEQYGREVIDAASGGPVVLAVPVEESGQDWFTLQWGEQWTEHVAAIAPDYAKVLVRDNPSFDAGERHAQLDRLAAVSSQLTEMGVPFLYELLVPATDAQKRAGAEAYDRDVRPDLVAQVLGDNHAAGVEPTMWKVEGLETVGAAEQVAAAATAGGRDADLIVLGRDAPAARLDHWLEVAAQVERFVGFAIGRSIWEEVIRDHEAGQVDDREARARIAERYLGFARHWSVAAAPARTVSPPPA
jgi:myo-inositol catabolism protein IolC